MKRSSKILIVVVCVIAVANIQPFSAIFRLFLDERHYQYSNYNGSSTFSEFMSRDFQMAKRRHYRCLLASPELKDRQMYRIFSKNPLAFWRWRLYFYDEKYKLPYRDFEQIKKERELEQIKAITGCVMEF